ncbi:MAG TPA: hypothetical protein VKH19_16120 [Gemmatimonadaceae bacterium]|nr:hypothetical protein [Gemmatimonadaceae bacterium]
MFIGHFATAFAGKRVDARISLGWTFAACQAPDLLWPIFSLIGMEHFRIVPGDTAFTPLSFDYYPWSHSLVMDIVWGLALGLIYLARSGDRRGSAFLAALVVGHWVLDWITHRPDLSLTLTEEHRVGLGLWSSVAGTIAVEVLLYAAAVWLYLRTTVARDRVGRIGAWSLAGALGAIYVANIVSPPPPSTTAVSIAALALWAFIPLAAWIDRHRTPAHRVVPAA